MGHRECTELPSGPLTPSQDKRFQLRDNLDIHFIPEVEAGVCLQQLGFARRAAERPELASCQLSLSGSEGPAGVSSAPGSCRHPGCDPGFEGLCPGGPGCQSWKVLHRPDPRLDLVSFLTDEETEAHRAKEACPRSHSESAADSGFEPDFPDSQVWFGTLLGVPSGFPFCLLFV